MLKMRTLVYCGVCVLFFAQVSLGQYEPTARDPCQSKNKKSAHETHCDRYYECTHDGQAAVKNCPNGLVYLGFPSHSPHFGYCDYDFKVDCTDRPSRNGPISTEHCDWLYGIFGHETSCTRYWTCWNGTATELQCIGGLLYNEETHACDWPENVPGCQKHPLCKDDANGNVALGKSCNRYWQCQGGYPRLQRCPAMLVFDKRSLRCVIPPTEDCDIPSTTPAPEDEVGNNNNAPENTRGGSIALGIAPSRPQALRPRPQQQTYVDDDNNYGPQGRAVRPNNQQQSRN